MSPIVKFYHFVQYLVSNSLLGRFNLYDASPKSFTVNQRPILRFTSKCDFELLAEKWHTCIISYMHTCIHEYWHTCIVTYLHTCIFAFLHTCILAYLRTCILPNKKNYTRFKTCKNWLVYSDLKLTEVKFLNMCFVLEQLLPGNLSIKKFIFGRLFLRSWYNFEGASDE